MEWTDEKVRFHVCGHGYIIVRVKRDRGFFGNCEGCFGTTNLYKSVTKKIGAKKKTLYKPVKSRQGIFKLKRDENNYILELDGKKAISSFCRREFERLTDIKLEPNESVRFYLKEV